MKLNARQQESVKNDQNRTEFNRLWAERADAPSVPAISPNRWKKLNSFGSLILNQLEDRPSSVPVGVLYDLFYRPDLLKLAVKAHGSVSILSKSEIRQLNKIELVRYILEDFRNLKERESELSEEAEESRTGFKQYKEVQELGRVYDRWFATHIKSYCTAFASTANWHPDFRVSSGGYGDWHRPLFVGQDGVRMPKLKRIERSKFERLSVLSKEWETRGEK